MELFGKEIPIVFFAPIGFRLNSTLTSKRYLKFIDGIYPEISSQIALTRDIYNLEPNNRKTEFH
ncbi:637_t:CDS:1, partial [Entrophospora sp. SA101]